MIWLGVGGRGGRLFLGGGGFGGGGGWCGGWGIFLCMIIFFLLFEVFFIFFKNKYIQIIFKVSKEFDIIYMLNCFYL